MTSNEQRLAALAANRSAQATEARKQRDVMRALTSSEGWRIVADFIRAQIESRQGLIFLEEDCARIDYKRGEVGALLLIERFPKVVIDQAEAALAAFVEERNRATTSVKGERSSSSAEADDTSGWTDEDDGC